MARATVGLDIGTSAVRAAELRGADPPMLVRFAQLGLSAGTVVGGEIADGEAVASAIRELWKRGEFGSRRVAVAVANPGVVVREVEMPRMEESELRSALQFQVQDYIPISAEDAVLDYVPLEEFTGEEGEMMRLLAVAAQKEMINAFVSVVARAGLDPVGVDIAPLAAVRALSESVPSVVAEVGAEGVVDIGAGVTNVVVHEHGSPRFVRILPSGGNDITAGLVAELGIAAEEAEAHKLAIGLQADGTMPAAGAAGVIERHARVFLDDVRRSLEYYQSQPRAAPLHRVLLTGGGARLPRLRERLAAALHVPVEHGRPLQRVQLGDLGLSDQQLEYVDAIGAVAIGLALED